MPHDTDPRWLGIDAAYRPFAAFRRRFIVADAPGDSVNKGHRPTRAVCRYETTESRP